MKFLCMKRESKKHTSVKKEKEQMGKMYACQGENCGLTTISLAKTEKL